MATRLFPEAGVLGHEAIAAIRRGGEYGGVARVLSGAERGGVRDGIGRRDDPAKPAGQLEEGRPTSLVADAGELPKLNFADIERYATAILEPGAEPPVLVG